MSRPLLQAINKKIEELGGDEWVFDQIADGKAIGKIAELVGCSRPYLYNWRDQKGPGREERKRLWAEAIKASAEAHAEKAGEVLDDLSSKDLLIPADVTLATARSKYSQWLAGVRDKEAFGDAKGQVNLNLNFGQLHLDALRQAGSMARVKAAEVVELMPAEVVEEEETDG